MTALSRRDVLAATGIVALASGAGGSAAGRPARGEWTASGRPSRAREGAPGRPASAIGPGQNWGMYQSDARNTGFSYGHMAPATSLGVTNSYDVGGEVAGPPVLGYGRVIVQRRDGAVRGFADDGTAWTAVLDERTAQADDGTAEPDVGTTEADDGTASARRAGTEVAPLVGRDAVYAGRAGGRLYALDPTTGDRRWHFDADATGRSSASPLLVPVSPDELAVCWTVGDGEGGGSAYALSAETGEPRWRFTLDDLRADRSPAADDAKLFVAGARTLHAVDVFDGGRAWRFDVDGELTSAPAVVDGTVLVGADGAADDGAVVYALDTDGELQWTFRGTGPVDASPAGFGSAVYVGSRDGSLSALDAATGERRWRVDLGAPVDLPSAFNEHSVYVTTRSGTLAAVDRETGERTDSVDLGADRVTSPVITDGIGVGSGRSVRWIGEVEGADRTETRSVPLEDWWVLPGAAAGLTLAAPLVLGALALLAERFGDAEE